MNALPEPKCKHLTTITPLRQITGIDPMRNTHFAAVKHTYVDEVGIQRASHVMTIKDDMTGLILSYPGYEVLSAPYEGAAPLYLKGDVRPHLHYVAHALNYIFKDNYARYGATTLGDVTPHMLYDAFDAYAYGSVGGIFRGQESINNYIAAVCSFFANLSAVSSDCKIKPEDIFHEVQVLKSKKNGDLKVVYMPRYRIKSLSAGESKLQRDISTKALDLLITTAEIHDPMLVFPLRAMRYTGMRLGEIVNLRQKDSPVCKTPGISFRRRGDTITSITIDIRHEHQLRADGKQTGGIKRGRKVEVYKPYIPQFMVAYEYHMRLLESVQYDRDYCPMIVDNKGNAMTGAAFGKRFAKLVRNHFVPALLDSDDLELIEYAQDLYNLNLRPHVFRHYFTVQLVLDGLSAEVIARFRGDKSTESAQVYVRNKGALMDRVHNVHDHLIDNLMQEAAGIDETAAAHS